MTKRQYYEIQFSTYPDIVNLKQFREMLGNAESAVIDIKRIPHKPIVDIASSYKNAHREAMLFEYRVGDGNLLVCTLNLSNADPAALYLREAIISYAKSIAFNPRDVITPTELRAMLDQEKIAVEENSNEAANKNDITMNC